MTVRPLTDQRPRDVAVAAERAGGAGRQVLQNTDLSTRTVGVVPPGGVAPPAGSTTAADSSLKGWQAGAAGNWTLGTNDPVRLRPHLRSEHASSDDTPLAAYPTGFGPFSTRLGQGHRDDRRPQAFAALAVHINNWLTLRFRRDARWSSDHQVRGPGDRPHRRGEGVSVPRCRSARASKLGSLQLDGVFNDSFPQTLGGFFSNTADYVSFTRVTVTYPF